MRSWTGAHPLTMTSSPTRAVEGPTVIVSHRRPRTHRRGFGAFSLIATFASAGLNAQPEIDVRHCTPTSYDPDVNAWTDTPPFRATSHAVWGTRSAIWNFRGDSQRTWTPCSTKPPQPSQQRLAKVSRDGRDLLRCPVRTTLSPGLTVFRTEESETLTVGAGVVVVVSAVVGELETPSTKACSATTTELLRRLGTRKHPVKSPFSNWSTLSPSSGGHSELGSRTEVAMGVGWDRGGVVPERASPATGEHECGGGDAQSRPYDSSRRARSRDTVQHRHARNVTRLSPTGNPLTWKRHLMALRILE